MMRIGGIDLNTITTVDGSMDEKWLCTPCVLRWKHKYHTLSPRAEGEQTSVNLKAILLDSLADDPETRFNYEEWAKEQEESPLVVHYITEATDEDVESILRRAFGEPE